jgi:hypothetical protein
VSGLSPIKHFIDMLFATVDREAETVAHEVMQRFSTVIAWFTASYRIFNRKTLNKEIDLVQISYSSYKSLEYDPDVTIMKLKDNFPDYRFNETVMNRLVARSQKAKVHCEAALMAWFYSMEEKGRSVGPIYFSCCLNFAQFYHQCNQDTEKEEGQDEVKSTSRKLLPIGVSKKCCRLCWLLGQEFNKRDIGPQFLLPGTHSTHCAWIPPPGIPTSILKALRNSLLRDLKVRSMGSHSRQSSGAGSEKSPNTVVFPLPGIPYIDDLFSEEEP